MPGQIRARTEQEEIKKEFTNRAVMRMTKKNKKQNEEKIGKAKFNCGSCTTLYIYTAKAAEGVPLTVPESRAA